MIRMHYNVAPIELKFRWVETIAVEMMPIQGLFHPYVHSQNVFATLVAFVPLMLGFIIHAFLPYMGSRS